MTSSQLPPPAHLCQVLLHTSLSAHLCQVLLLSEPGACTQGHPNLPPPHSSAGAGAGRASYLRAIRGLSYLRAIRGRGKSQPLALA